MKETLNKHLQTVKVKDSHFSGKEKAHVYTNKKVGKFSGHLGK
jgi:hypothetical protein